MATPAAEDVDTIRRRRVDILAERVQVCPVVPARTLLACLRSPSPCPPDCVFRGYWTGPVESA